LALAVARFATVHFGPLAIWQKTVITFLSVLPAWLSLHLIENPIRYTNGTLRQSRKAIVFGLSLTMLTGILGHATWRISKVPPPNEVERARAATSLRTMTLAQWISNSPITINTDSLVPRPAAALSDWYIQDCKTSKHSSELVSCIFGDAAGYLTIALVGDSMAQQWLSALDSISARNGWRIVSFIKGSCAWTVEEIGVPVDHHGEQYPECGQWSYAVSEELRALRPEVILTSQLVPYILDANNELSEQLMTDSLVSTWSEAISWGSKVGVVISSPQPWTNIPDCVERNSNSLSSCKFSLSNPEAFGAARVQQAAAELVKSVRIFDFTEHLCSSEECPAVIGDVLVYIDAHHLSRTFVDYLVPEIE